MWSELPAQLINPVLRKLLRPSSLPFDSAECVRGALGGTQQIPALATQVRDGSSRCGLLRLTQSCPLGLLLLLLLQPTICLHARLSSQHSFLTPTSFMLSSPLVFLLASWTGSSNISILQLIFFPGPPLDASFWTLILSSNPLQSLKHLNLHHHLQLCVSPQAPTVCHSAVVRCMYKKPKCIVVTWYIPKCLGMYQVTSVCFTGRMFTGTVLFFKCHMLYFERTVGIMRSCQRVF